MAEIGRRPARRSRVVRETPVSALARRRRPGRLRRRASRDARSPSHKAKQSGIAIVGANNTYYTGLFAYYLEMATREGLVAFAAGNGPAIVAPEGAIDARLGTNPIAFGFPSTGDPVIWDIGTCAIMHGEVHAAPPPGRAAAGRHGDRQRRRADARSDRGARRRDPQAWGGHRGSGLSIVVQLLGALCDAPVISPGMRRWPISSSSSTRNCCMPEGNYPERVSERRRRGQERAAPRSAADRPVRMPFDRSAADRRRRVQEDAIEVPDRVYEALVTMAARKHDAARAGLTVNKVDRRIAMDRNM